MKYAQIKNGVVTNIIILEDQSLLPYFSENFDQVINISSFVPEPEIGWTYNNGNFAQASTVEVFPDLTPRQIRIALLLQGITDGIIQNSFATLPEPNRSLAKITWEFALSFERYHPLVVEVAQQLGWTEEDLNNIWRQAVSI